MSARRGNARSLARLFRGPRRKRKQRRSVALIGRDLATMPLGANPRSRLVPVAIVGALIGGLCLAALRVDLIRQRYDLAEAMQTERELLDQKRLLTARVQRLRDPARLARLAEERGFVRPARVIDVETLDVAAGPRP
jgi:hypothetical protein